MFAYNFAHFIFSQPLLNQDRLYIWPLNVEPTLDDPLIYNNDTLLTVLTGGQKTNT